MFCLYNILWCKKSRTCLTSWVFTSRYKISRVWKIPIRKWSWKTPIFTIYILVDINRSSFIRFCFGLLVLLSSYQVVEQYTIFFPTGPALEDKGKLLTYLMKNLNEWNLNLFSLKSYIIFKTTTWSWKLIKSRYNYHYHYLL